MAKDRDYLGGLKNNDFHYVPEGAKGVTLENAIILVFCSRASAQW
jgi:hypothetical protein